VAHGLKVSEAQAREVLASLVAAQLVQDPGNDLGPVRLTATGTQVFGQIRCAVTEITDRLWRDLPASDLATAGRVLSIITERASAELASPEPGVAHNARSHHHSHKATPAP
jgi:hypothetical protein